MGKIRPRRNIPFVKFGLKFLDAAHVKDILALLRFVENPRDGIAGFRLMQLIPWVGPTSAKRVLDHMTGAADPIRALLAMPPPPRAATDWKAFVETVTNLSAERSGWPAELECARRWYEPHLELWNASTRMPSGRRADLIQLEQIASGYPSRDMRKGMNGLALQVQQVLGRDQLLAARLAGV
jgi:DNA helicase II / ATP-dependent DNA helicase PcrA